MHLFSVSFSAASAAFLFLVSSQVFRIADSASVGKSSAENETQSDIDLVLDLFSSIDFNASDLAGSLESLAASAPSTDASLPPTAKTAAQKPARPQSLKDLGPSDAIGVPKASLERTQSKGLDAYYPKGTQNLRNYAKMNDNTGRGIWSLFRRSFGGSGIMNPFRSIIMTLYGGGKGSLRQKMWLVKQLYREEEQSRRRKSFDRTTGDLRTRFMRSMVQKTFNHYKKNTAMMEMLVQDRNDRLQRFTEIPGVAEMLNTPNSFPDDNESIDALSLLSDSFFSLGGFLRNQV